MVEEKEQGGGIKEVKRNCFWQLTTATDDNDANAARHEYEDASLGETR